MAKIVVMPKLGLTMTKGEVTKWHKAEGEQVNAGEALFDVATDKLTNEVEATESGILRKIFVKENESTACLEPVGIIAGAEEDINFLLTESNHEPDPMSTPITENIVESKTVDNARNNGKIKASPVAKKLAAEKNVDLALIMGTGPNGRIVLEDVEAYIKNPAPKVKASPMAEKLASQNNVDLSEINKDSRIMKADVLNHLQEQKAAMEANPMETRIPMTQMRKVISKRMSESWQNPTVTYDLKVDMTRLKELRNQLKDIYKLTFTDLLVKIVSTTLLEFPYLNSSLENNEIITRNYVNMGVAVAVDEGLLVPIVKFANTKGLKQISTEVKELADKARNNKLTPDDLSGGTFTITNLGMYGIDSFSPIINLPQVAILGVNSITETPVVVNGQIVIKPLMNLSLTADHRVVDGAVAAEFLAKVKQYLEKPEILLL